MCGVALNGEVEWGTAICSPRRADYFQSTFRVCRGRHCAHTDECHRHHFSNEWLGLLDRASTGGLSG